MLTAAGRTDANGESGLVRPGSLGPTATAETRSLPDSAGLFEGDPSTAHRASNVPRPVNIDWLIISVNELLKPGQTFGLENKTDLCGSIWKYVCFIISAWNNFWISW